MMSPSVVLKYCVEDDKEEERNRRRRRGGGEVEREESLSKNTHATHKTTLVFQHGSLPYGRLLEHTHMNTLHKPT